MDIYISTDARVRFLDDGTIDLKAIAVITSNRASHIFPENRFKRWMFVFLRDKFGENGFISDWTRTWDGPWVAVIKGTGLAFKHKDRHECIKWEHEVVNELLGRAV